MEPYSTVSYSLWSKLYLSTYLPNSTVKNSIFFRATPFKTNPKFSVVFWGNELRYYVHCTSKIWVSKLPTRLWNLNQENWLLVGWGDGALCMREYHIARFKMHPIMWRMITAAEISAVLYLQMDFHRWNILFPAVIIRRW